MRIPEREFERLKELCVICGAKVIMLIFIPSKRLLKSKENSPPQIRLKSFSILYTDRLPSENRCFVSPSLPHIFLFIKFTE